MHSEGYSSRSVCLCVCLSTTILALQATRRLMSDTNSFSATRASKITCDFAETIAFERYYGVKTSEKANVHNERWLTWTALAHSAHAASLHC